VTGDRDGDSRTFEKVVCIAIKENWLRMRDDLGEMRVCMNGIRRIVIET